jgi:hypothetical protein
VDSAIRERRRGDLWKMQAEEALHAATRGGSPSGSNGRGDERAGEPGDRVDCGFRATRPQGHCRAGRPRGWRVVQPQGWPSGRSRPRRAGNRCENTSSRLDVSAGYTRRCPLLREWTCRNVNLELRAEERQATRTSVHTPVRNLTPGCTQAIRCRRSRVSVLEGQT